VHDEVLAVDETRAVAGKKNRGARDVVGQARARDRLDVGEKLLHQAGDLVRLGSFHPSALGEDAGDDRAGREAVDPYAVLAEFDRDGTTLAQPAPPELEGPRQQLGADESRLQQPRV